MQSSHSLDRLDTAFDDHRLVADAGLLLPATLGACLQADARPRRAGLTVTMLRYAMRDVREAGPC